MLTIHVTFPEAPRNVRDYWYEVRKDGVPVGRVIEVVGGWSAGGIAHYPTPMDAAKARYG